MEGRSWISRNFYVYFFVVFLHYFFYHNISDSAKLGLLLLQLSLNEHPIVFPFLGKLQAEKKGTCHKIAADTWQKIKAFFGLDATPLPGTAKGNARPEEVELSALPSEPPRSQQRAPNSANPTSPPRPRPATRRDKNGNQAFSQPSRGPSGSHQKGPAPKGPYDNGFLSAPRDDIVAVVNV
ncbi:hypothetical protein F5Y00DRAFT_261310 [Daldinia vernicosa]|uniref:uncharacterized protein n=1 Tax=Daldinia vernicosa TaxID=114800 RepID=UPI0020080581|nr:uncharacterized protein F5Y00DRAFT_261310 [Daldinia vernicosa]KAI0849526.1 hypothetical protein F5Y00DRAFT_261310 [Daldinia vernicosa]